MQTSKIQTALRASISTTLLLAASGAFAQGVSITAPGVNVQVGAGGTSVTAKGAAVKTKPGQGTSVQAPSAM